MKICGLTTLGGTIQSFMIENFSYMIQHGHKAYCISNYDESLEKIAKEKGITYFPRKMKWGNVSVFEVIGQVFYLWKVFRRERFDIIQYATSNAALYASVAGWLASVPVRIHLQWGITYPEYHGMKRWFYRTMEKLTSMLSTSVQPDSKANLAFSIQDRLIKSSKGEVLYNGSACGVNLSKYDITKKDEWRSEIRKNYHIPMQAKVFGYVGRVVVEKGINEMLGAFLSLGEENTFLLVVGSLDDAGRLNQLLFEKAKQMPNILFVGPVPNAAKYFAAMDFLLLPSYREGFGMTVLEAAGVGTPSIVSNIKGPTDFVTDGLNGLICEVKSTESLKDNLIKALSMDDETYRQLCQNAYQIVKHDFDSEEFKKRFLENRVRLFQDSCSKKKYC